MSSRLSRLPGLRGTFGRGVATLATGTGIAQILVIATSPILTRVYQPDDFGAYAVAVSILSVLLTITCLRYDIAIPLPPSGEVAANLLALSLLAAAATSLLAMTILLVAGTWLVALLGAPTLTGFILILPIAQFAAGVGNAFSGWALRTRTFGAIAGSRVVQGLVVTIGQLALGALRLGPPGLLIGDAAGRSAGSIQLVRAGWRLDSALLRRASWSGIAAAAQRYRRFPLITSWSALLSALGQQSPVLLIVAAYGSDVGGRYALAARVGALPLALVAAAVSQVYVAETANLARTTPRDVKYLFTRTTRVLALAGVLPALLVILLAPVLAGPVFGTPWAPVGVYLAILSPSFFLEFAVGATGDVLLVLERQGLHLVREVVRFLLIGGAIPVAAALGMSDVGAVIFLSVGRSLTYLAYGLVSWYAVDRFVAARTEPTAGPQDPLARGLGGRDMAQGDEVPE